MKNEDLKERISRLYYLIQEYNKTLPSYISVENIRPNVSGHCLNW